MADKEHLRILKAGVTTWNQWRKEHRDIRPNLSRADLSETDLSGADFSGANLTGALLDEANLTRALLDGAGLSEANLYRADLRNGDLRGADLSGAHLDEADLRGADLRRAHLNEANLRGAYLDRADLSEAFVGRTVFGELNLGVAQGLESVIHLGPSTIGIDTVYAARGRIPEVFLRGAGVPDEFIAYIRSLVGRAIEFYSCFISYSSKDQGFAERLYADLQDEGVRCWFAQEDMKIGDKIRDRLDHAIRRHDKMLLVLSANSIGSEWVEDEVTIAFEEERRRDRTVLFPVRVDHTIFDTEEPWAAKARQRHIGDFCQWKQPDVYQKAFDRLLRDLKAEGAQR
jgi:hypothetical protein